MLMRLIHQTLFSRKGLEVRASSPVLAGNGWCPGGIYINYFHIHPGLISPFEVEDTPYINSIVLYERFIPYGQLHRLKTQNTFVKFLALDFTAV